MLLNIDVCLTRADIKVTSRKTFAMIRPMIFSARNLSLVLALVLVMGALCYTGGFHDEGPPSYASSGVTQLDSDQLDNLDLHNYVPSLLVYFASGLFSTPVVIQSSLVSLFVLPESRAPPHLSS